MDASEGVFGDMMASRFLNKPLEGIDFAFSLESVTTPTEEKTIIDTPVEAMKKDEEEKDVESMNGLPPALAELLAPIREDREFETSTLGDIPSIPSRTATSPASIPSAEHNDFTCPPATGSYQSRFINHQKNNVNPYEKIPPNPRKRSSLFLGSGFTKGSIRGLPKGGSGRFTVEELIEMDPELNDFQEDSPFAQEDDERVTMKKVTGKEDMNEADGKMKTMSLASSTRATSTMSRRHHIRDIFGPLVEVPVSELEQETSSSSEPPAYDPAEESTKKTQNGDSLTLLGEKLDGDKNGSVMLVRKSHLRKLEAKLAELENQLANSQDGQSEKGVGKEARGEISHSHKRTDSAISNISNGDDVVALVPAETASRYSSLKGKQPKEWFLAQSDDPSEGVKEPLVSSEANVSVVEKKRELNMGWSELGSFCLAASAGIGVVIGQVVFSKLLRK
ncbi:hypothetical protein BT69DRAFT_796989 [Atractiella rhizophila]|nr:hypothetical protein BT69DRAFT_796989 [Atractiella rhizophila]